MTFAAVYTDEGSVGTCIDPYFTNMWLRILLFSTMEEAVAFLVGEILPIGRKNPMWRIATSVDNDGYGDVIDYT